MCVVIVYNKNAFPQRFREAENRITLAEKANSPNFYFRGEHSDETMAE